MAGSRFENAVDLLLCCVMFHRQFVNWFRIPLPLTYHSDRGVAYISPTLTERR